MKSILFIVITLATVAPAQISNVHQKGEDGHVVITYDLSGEEGKTYNVFVTATSADGDTIIPRAIVGDVTRGFSRKKSFHTVGSTSRGNIFNRFESLAFHESRDWH